MSKLVVNGRKCGDGLKILFRRGMDKWIEALQEGEDVEISFHKVSDFRTHNQNRLYWKFLRLIAKAYGEHDEYSFHDYFKSKKLCYTVIINNEEILHCKSTAELTKKEFSEYIEFIMQWASETLGLVLASPEEAKFIREAKNGD